MTILRVSIAHILTWRRVPFSFKDVSKMSATSRASDFRPQHPKSAVFVASDGAWYSYHSQALSRVVVTRITLNAPVGTGLTIKERRPSTSTLELCRTLVQRSVARATCIHALLVELVKLARVGCFGTLFTQNTELQYSRKQVSISFIRAYTIETMK